jgi:hypothetical protein
MSHRRQVQKGSFGTHLDELVRHFPEAPAMKFGSLKDRKLRKPKVESPACVNRLLLDETSH